MTAIDPLATSGTTAGQTARKTTGPQLGQDSFLKLLTTQLQNQNPLEPLQNSDFIGQMAQFSTVSGIEQINSTLETMAAGSSQSGLSAVSGLIGRQVLVETAQTRADAAGNVAGRVALQAPASAVVISYSDAVTGRLLQTQSFGATPTGDLAFDWADSSLAGQNIRVSVSATTAEGTADLPPQLYARITGGAPGLSGGEATLEVEGFGQISALEVRSIR